MSTSEQWLCRFCETLNVVADAECIVCDKPRGYEAPPTDATPSVVPNPPGPPSARPADVPAAPTPAAHPPPAAAPTMSPSAPPRPMMPTPPFTPIPPVSATPPAPGNPASVTRPAVGYVGTMTPPPHPPAPVVVPPASGFVSSPPGAPAGAPVNPYPEESRGGHGAPLSYSAPSTPTSAPQVVFVATGPTKRPPWVIPLLVLGFVLLVIIGVLIGFILTPT